MGVKRLISNRPDAEEPGQPSAAEMETAARDAGMDFAWISVSGLPDATQARAVADLLADGALTVMFCRSGMRSTIAWAMAETLSGRITPDEARAAAAAAGYDLERIPL